MNSIYSITVTSYEFFQISNIIITMYYKLQSTTQYTLMLMCHVIMILYQLIMYYEYCTHNIYEFMIYNLKNNKIKQTTIFVRF